MSQKPISLADVRKRLDRISTDIEKSTEKGLTAAARDLSGLESELGNSTFEATPLSTYVSSARTTLGVGKLEAAQDWILKARFLTEPGKKGPS